MNDATPPPGTPHSDRPDQQPGGTDRFFAWIRGLGISRSDDRWFAGVAAGIAAKAKIDPIIVRGVFVVLALLGGPGFLLYLAAWLLLPDSSGRIHLEQLFRGQASTAAIVGSVLLGVFVVIPLLIWSARAVFAGPWGWSQDFLPDWLTLVLGILWWAVLVPAGIIWLIVWLSTGAGRASRPPAGHYSSTTQSTQFADKANEFAEKAGAAANEFAEKTGTAAHNWAHQVDQKSREWEQWSREHHERNSLSAGFVSISLALALLAGGIAAAVAFALSGGSHLTFVIGLIAAVTVLALSMIVAGIRGRDSGWVGFFAFCGVIALVFAPVSQLLPQHTEVVPFGEVTVRSTDAGGDRAMLMIAGNVSVDLEDLTRRADARTIDVWLLGGNATVRLPETHPTRVQLNLLAGNVRDTRLSDDERRQGGIFVSRMVQVNTENVPSDEVTSVRIRLLGGNIYVEDRLGASEASRDTELESDAKLDREIERLREQIEELENAR